MTKELKRGSRNAIRAERVVEALQHNPLLSATATADLRLALFILSELRGAVLSAEDGISKQDIVDRLWDTVISVNSNLSRN